jgi:tetratricopeptide (TPR) repeat protein/serine/threonine protein kinase
MQPTAHSIESILAAAVEMSSEAQRRQFVEQACAGNAELLRRVEELIENHFRAGSFLESPAPHLVATANEPAGEGSRMVIGPYKLMEQIGEGGMGLVFVAEQQQPVRRKVALKLIKPGMDTREVIARFEVERQALALMDHPNIAKVLDAGETPPAYAGGSPRPYFVMELVHGIPITQFCDDNRLPARQRLELFLAVCQAVQHAHTKGIIHRDLKPSNILVTLHDGAPVVKVIDFGVAKAVGQQLTDKTVYTHFLQMIGTPLYMSPEQAGMSGQDIDTRTDIYALGVLLYELLTGATPFDQERLRAAGLDEMRRIIREEEPPRPSTRISTLGQAAVTVSAQRQSDPKRLSQLMRGELDWIVMKALEKDRNRRYETASAFAADVQRYLDDEPVQACPPSAWYRWRKFVRRNRRALVTASVLGLALLVAVGSVAGSIGWQLQERAGRRETTSKGVQQALQDAAKSREQGKIAQAWEALRKAEGFLAGGEEVPPELAQAVSQERTDLETIALAEEARLSHTKFHRGAFDQFSAEPYFAKAFKHYGLDLETLAVEAAATRIRKSGIRDHLLAALYEWAFVVKGDKDKNGRDRLLAVARLADDDTGRTQFLDMARRRQRKGLVRLAKQFDVLKEPPASIILLGEALFAAGAEREAVELLRRGQRLHPDDFWMNHDLAIQLVELKDRRHQETAEAVGLLQAALAIRPKSPGVHNNLAGALHQAGRLEEAEAHYRQAIELAKELGEYYVDAYRNLGLLRHKQGKYQEALALFDQVLRRRPKYPGAHCNRGDALEELNRLEEAAEAFRKALRFQKEMQDKGFTPATDLRADAYLGLGTVRMKQAKWPEALASLRRAQEFDQAFIRRGYQGYPEIPFYLGQVLEHLGRPKEAIREYQKSLKINPRGYSARGNLATIYWHMKDYATAEREYRKVLADKPDCAEAWTNLGAVMNQTQRYAEAEKCFKEAARHGPKNAMTYYDLGIALVALGRLAEAEKAYRKTIELNKNYAEAHCNLGGVLRRQGKFKEALAEYRRGHELGRRIPGWPYPSQLWVKEHARLAELDGMLAAVLRGDSPPEKPFDFFGVAQFAVSHRKLPAAAARLYGKGLQTLPITGQFKSDQLYNGACAACLAATGTGGHALKLDSKERARLRDQALRWLRAALAFEKEQSKKAGAAERAVIRKRIQHWLVDADLASLRDPAALSELAAEQSTRWLGFWADVLAFQAQLRPAP